MESPDHAAIRRRDIHDRSLYILELDVVAKIFARQSRTPKKVEHGARKMFVRFAHDFRAPCRRKFVTENRFQIAQSHAPACAIKNRGHAPGPSSQLIAGLARKQRHDL
jgi:hypothetical protein